MDKTPYQKQKTAYFECLYNFCTRTVWNQTKIECKLYIRLCKQIQIYRDTYFLINEKWIIMK